MVLVRSRERLRPGPQPIMAFRSVGLAELHGSWWPVKKAAIREIVPTIGKSGPRCCHSLTIGNSLPLTIAHSHRYLSTVRFSPFTVAVLHHRLFILAQIVTKQSRSLTLNLHNKNGQRGLKILGTLTIHAEETVASRNVVEITFRCSHLDNKDLFSKSDPFLRISRIVESGGAVPICKTEVVNNNLNPIWKPVCLTMQQFGSKDNPLVIECFDFNSNGNHVLIGKLQKSVADLEKIGANFIFPSSRNRAHDKVLKGQLFVDGFCEKKLYSFLDYISSGFELNFMVAVDFTASNGNPRNPDSLHYIDPTGRLNAYQQVIMEVGEVIQFYDFDRRFPAWGFGGRTYDSSISHCFNLNGGASGFEVEGIEGIMAAYGSALRNVALAGPTLFGQVINTAAEIAGRSLSQDSSKYFVLLIIMDGVLTDLQETKDALVMASDLPLSILIVGVGGADFKQMEILDADNGHRLESSTGRIATRDIVQFVPMRDVHGFCESFLVFGINVAAAELCVETWI
ncbi:hypothetical protein TEA_013336 [Camellia sinensis var. sinensis]|uniref:C2 domain-containing protein n=1 Tax=Camellia sinensis var. sinensis TaxID=542762 RepID=A0A4S4EUV9_CAMSN|nr:hypothetical protein TEA_013336 [Camellia sinensis var. sinensis]